MLVTMCEHAVDVRMRRALDADWWLEFVESTGAAVGKVYVPAEDLQQLLQALKACVEVIQGELEKEAA